MRFSFSLRRWLINAGLFLLAAFATVALLEAGFRRWGAVSDAWGDTLAAQLWFSRYWGPLNAQGYRDRPHTAWHGKRTVFMIGDSFLAGYGIKDRRDRFADVLQRKLGDTWEVFNLGECGIDTREELGHAHAARKFTGQAPDVLMLAYYVNDIMDAARRCDKVAYVHPEPRPVLRPFVTRSFLLNFVYWRVYRLRHSDFWDLGAAVCAEHWRNEQVQQLHLQELQDVVDWSRQEGSRLVVVIFPHLLVLEHSSTVTARVHDFFAARAVPVLNLTPQLTAFSPDERVVNAVDPHPSVPVHRLVGELLVPYVLNEVAPPPPSS